MEDRYIKEIEEDFKAFKGRFDHHLAIYAKNGKELAALKNEVANVGKNIDSMKEMMANLFHEHKERINENDKRVQKLENWRWYLIGAFVVSSTVGYFIIQIILKKI